VSNQTETALAIQAQARAILALAAVTAIDPGCQRHEWHDVAGIRYTDTWRLCKGPSRAADLFERWSNEVDGIIGHATSRVVPYLITRSLALDMAARSAELGGAGPVVEASKTSAGRPMIVAWLPFPDAP